MTWRLRLALLAIAATFAVPAHAHRTSDAFVTLDLHGAALTGQWEIALRDLEVAEGVDADRDGQLTWGELRGARERVARDLQRQLSIDADGRACLLQVTDLLINDRVEGRFAWLGLRADCPGAPRTLTLHYDLLFPQDPSHRGILVLNAAGIARTAVFAPAHRDIQVELAQASRWQTFRDFAREGVHHIWIGADHILFLVSLLLPCVLVRTDGRWHGTARLAPALWEVLGVVTAFTAAHSITLTLAALDVIRLPSRLTESAIALTVLVAALNNVRPVVLRARWGMAFGFGLVHGFGFASVLGELGLPAGARLLSLVAFNIGVEIGQLGIVAIAVPLAYALRDTWAYRRVVVTAGSIAVAAVALYWLVQRAGGLA